MTSELRCSRSRHLANAIHTLHCASFLDTSSWEEPELSHCEQSFSLVKSLFGSEMLRASLLRPPDKSCLQKIEANEGLDDALEADVWPGRKGQTAKNKVLCSRVRCQVSRQQIEDVYIRIPHPLHRPFFWRLWSINLLSPPAARMLFESESPSCAS
eukprot:s143_g21.t1